MGHFELVDQMPTAANPAAWFGTNAGNVPISLPFALGSAGLGIQMDRPLLLPILRLHIALIVQLIDVPATGPMRLRPHFKRASAHLQRLASEATGLAAASTLAEHCHGWNPSLGWPRDLDAPPVAAGVRPDVAFPVAGQGEVCAEARGRSSGRRLLSATTRQNQRMAALTAWSTTQGTKVFMAWAWSTTQRTRVDHFDPGERAWVHDPAEIEGSLRRQAQQAFQSAVEADAPLESTGTSRVRGSWITPPDFDGEVFIGIKDPEDMSIDLRSTSDPASEGALDRLVGRERMATASVAEVGPIVTAVRERGEDTPLEELRRRQQPQR